MSRCGGHQEGHLTVTAGTGGLTSGSRWKIAGAERWPARLAPGGRSRGQCWPGPGSGAALPLAPAAPGQRLPLFWCDGCPGRGARQGGEEGFAFGAVQAVARSPGLELGSGVRVWFPTTVGNGTWRQSTEAGDLGIVTLSSCTEGVPGCYQGARVGWVLRAGAWVAPRRGPDSWPHPSRWQEGHRGHGGRGGSSEGQPRARARSVQTGRRGDGGGGQPEARPAKSQGGG